MHALLVALTLAGDGVGVEAGAARGDRGRRLVGQAVGDLDLDGALVPVAGTAGPGEAPARELVEGVGVAHRSGAGAGSVGHEFPPEGRWRRACTPCTHALYKGLNGESSLFCFQEV